MKGYGKVKLLLFAPLFLLLFLAVFFSDSHFSYLTASGQTDEIRVGLTKEFREKQELRLENKALILGFSLRNKFHSLQSLEVEKGLRFQRAGGGISLLQGEYSSLELAKEEMKRLGRTEEDGVFPVFSGMKGKKARWQLSFSELDEDFHKVDGKKVIGDGLLFVEGGGFRFYINALEAHGYPQFKAENGFVSLNGKRYRGRIEIGSYGGSGVTAVNVVKLEDYLKGVLPLEMGYTWHIAAMKAQAVAARSFAIATAGLSADSDVKKGYKLNNHSHQSYGGYDVEGEKPNRAVKETKGEFLTYQNRVVRAYFYSSSGGATERAENVWMEDKAYLGTVSDIYEDAPTKKPWVFRFTKEEAEEALRQYATAKGVNLGDLASLEIKETSESGRVVSLKVIGTKGDFFLKKNEIRRAFSLPSTKFSLFKEGEVPDKVSLIASRRSQAVKEKKRLKNLTLLSAKGKKRISESGGKEELLTVISGKNRKGLYLGDTKAAYLFAGTGFGHGVGMSQSGAKGMAEAGYSYREILEHYYKGAKIQ